MELYGPKCTVDGCDGILVTRLNNSNHDLYRKCSKCKSEAPWLAINIQDTNESEDKGNG